MAIYAGGIVLNDVFDVEVDRLERPNRPLPSGRVSWKLAAWFGGMALILGPVLAWTSGSTASLVVASGLAACVLLYDAGLKRTVLGPEAMGACRGLNLLLGMSQSAAMGGPSAWLAAGALGLFVAGVTWISRSEVETGPARGLLAGFVLQIVALIGLIVAGVWLRREAGTAGGPVPWFGLLVFLLLDPIIVRASLAALRRPEPAILQKAVKTGVLSLVWLDVALVACVQGPGPALAVAALWVPAFLLGKWLYST